MLTESQKCLLGSFFLVYSQRKRKKSSLTKLTTVRFIFCQIVCLNLVTDSTRSVVIEVEYGLWEKCYSSQENNTLYNSCVKFLDNKDDTPGKNGQSTHKGNDIFYIFFLIFDGT